MRLPLIFCIKQDSKMQVHVELSQLHLSSQKSSISMVLNNLNRVLESDFGKAKLLKILKSKQNPKILTTSYNSRRISHLEYVSYDHNNTILLGTTSCDKPEAQSVSNSSHAPEVYQHIQFSSPKKSNSDITNWSLHRKGYSKKNTFVLRHNTTPLYIGRSNDCNLQCLAGNISRRHCKLICQTTKSKNTTELPGDYDVEWSIQDLGSMTGTYLNEEKLLKDKVYPLSNNDIVTLARSDCSPQDVIKDKYTFVYQVASPQTNTDALVLYKKSEGFK